MHPEPQPRTLAELLAYISSVTQPADGASRTAIATLGASPATAPATAPPAPELKAISQYRSTWKRLSADRRLKQALDKVPDNAGPLNTQRLLHEALLVMRDASPAYLQNFMAQVETLLWLEQVNQGGAVADKKGGTKRSRS